METDSEMSRNLSETTQLGRGRDEIQRHMCGALKPVSYPHLLFYCVRGAVLGLIWKQQW